MSVCLRILDGSVHFVKKDVQNVHRAVAEKMDAVANGALALDVELKGGMKKIKTLVGVVNSMIEPVSIFRRIMEHIFGEEGSP